MGGGEWVRRDGEDIFEGSGGLPEGEAGGAGSRAKGAGMPAGTPDGAIGHGPAGAIPDELVDRFFDNELDESARRAFLRSVPADLDRCEEVARTRRMLDMFKAGVVTGPDLTGRIIATVDRKRGFASRNVRR